MGNISCETKETNQLEINKDIKESINLQLKEKEQKSTKEKKPQKIIKSKKGFISNKTFNKKEIKKKNQNIKKIINPQRKANAKEKNKIDFNKDIKTIIQNDKKSNTISLENKIKSNFLKNEIKFPKRKTYNLVKHTKNKKIEIKKINYNDISNNLSNEFNDDEFIIVNNNDELDESIQFLGFSNSSRKSEKNELKKKIIKAKERIIDIKKELKNNKNYSESNIIKKEIKKNNNNNIRITINLSGNISDNINNNLNINNKQIENDNKVELKEDNIEKNPINILIKNEQENLNHKIEPLEINELIKEEININNYDNNIKNSNNNVINFNNIQKNKINNDKNKNNKIDFREKNIDSNITKKRNIQSIYSIELKTKNKSKNNTMKVNKNEKIINKIKEINYKINNKITPQKRKTYPIFDNKFSKIKRCETMDNRQIKNNIPSYRRGHSKSNYICLPTRNSCTYDKNKKTKKIKSNISLENSFNKSLCNSNVKTNIKKNNIYSNIYTFKKKKNSKDKYSVHQSYLNNSYIINISMNDINLTNSNKNIKNQRLYSLITKNIITKNNNKENNINNSDIIKNGNIEEILFQQFRDVAEIDISSINTKESLMDNKLLKSHVNKKIIVNYSKLDNLDKSQILFDGILYKIFENQNKFKLAERYFQIKKNCFRYYNNFEKGKNDSDNPLVQFDIRHMKSIDIIDSKIFKQYKINQKEIEFTFCIFLNQNDDFFAFVFNNEIFGNAIYNFLNLLKNYYEDKKQ